MPIRHKLFSYFLRFFAFFLSGCVATYFQLISLPPGFSGLGLFDLFLSLLMSASFFPPFSGRWLLLLLLLFLGLGGGPCRDSASDGIAQHVALMANSMPAGCAAYRAARNARYCHTSGLYLIFSRQVFVGSRGNSNNLLYRKRTTTTTTTTI